jgi:hypothetical protein
MARHLKERKRELYIIRNSRLMGERQSVSRNTLKIAGRAISALIQTQGIGDLYQLYVIAQRDGIDYNVCCIPSSFVDIVDELFDQQYMRKLYEVGRTLIREGEAWSNLPPGYNATVTRRRAAPVAAAAGPRLPGR